MLKLFLVAQRIGANFMGPEGLEPPNIFAAELIQLWAPKSLLRPHLLGASIIATLALRGVEPSQYFLQVGAYNQTSVGLPDLVKVS